jgi:hypothetical protein
MKVAMLVGALVIYVIGGLYQTGLVVDSERSAAGQVRACDGPFPPPPDWP